MFTGIIQELGIIEDIQSSGGGIRLRIRAPQSTLELQIHDSVSINGVCQTIIAKDESSFVVEAVEETLKKTAFGTLQVGEHVNLELPLKSHERLGGHIVLGHVDAPGVITKIERRQGSWMFSFSIPSSFMKYIIPVGSITVDGVSLTVAEIGENDISISIIPHTMENTVFQFRREGDAVNLEFDVIGKYIERLIQHRTSEFNEKDFLSEKHLRELGY